MRDDYLALGGPDDKSIRKERNKARALRKTRWWQQKTSTGTCYYCDEKVGFKDLTMDHIIPLTRGGRSTKDNLVPCCKKCNNEKKNALPIEWDQYMDHLATKKS
jgi:5-methylcytosine-specific restriction endonuclease McrA